MKQGKIFQMVKIGWVGSKSVGLSVTDGDTLRLYVGEINNVGMSKVREWSGQWHYLDRLYRSKRPSDALEAYEMALRYLDKEFIKFIPIGEKELGEKLTILQECFP